MARIHITHVYSKPDHGKSNYSFILIASSMHEWAKRVEFGEFSCLLVGKKSFAEHFGQSRLAYIRALPAMYKS